MSLVLRILLIIISVLSMWVMMKKIRHSKFQIEYAIYWILLSVLLVVLAVFPDITIKLADLIGIQSPVNMIFLVIIFLLLLKLFYLNIQVSQLEYKVNELIQKLALNEHGHEPKEHSEEDNYGK